MNQEQILKDLNLLPPSARQLVIDFIAFLRMRYTAEESEEVRIPVPLRDETFVGIWRGRKDMSDSSKWVCKVRTEEWG